MLSLLVEIDVGGDDVCAERDESVFCLLTRGHAFGFGVVEHSEEDIDVDGGGAGFLLE